MLKDFDLGLIVKVRGQKLFFAHCVRNNRPGEKVKTALDS